MATAFLFLDECEYKGMDLAALTGVLIPADSYVSVRDTMCRLVVEALPSRPNVIPAPVELHGRALLNEVEHLHGDRIDSVRLSVLQRVVDLVSDNKLQICRVAYLNRSEISAKMPIDPKLYGITFFGLQTWLQNVMVDTLVIPVMDGVPDTGKMDLPRKAPKVDPVLIRAFAGNVRGTHHFRQYPVSAENLPIENAHNLGEPIFGDSAHSVLLQLVDLVSYLLLQRERAEVEDDSLLTSYRQKVLKIAEALPADQLNLWKGKMSFYSH